MKSSIFPYLCVLLFRTPKNQFKSLIVARHAWHLVCRENESEHAFTQLFYRGLVSLWVRVFGGWVFFALRNKFLLGDRDAEVFLLNFGIPSVIESVWRAQRIATLHCLSNSINFCVMPFNGRERKVMQNDISSAETKQTEQKQMFRTFLFLHCHFVVCNFVRSARVFFFFGVYVWVASGSLLVAFVFVPFFVPRLFIIIAVAFVSCHGELLNFDQSPCMSHLLSTTKIAHPERQSERERENNI